MPVDVTPFGSKVQVTVSDATPSVVVPGVPDTITRADYMAWIESLGFEVKNLKSMRLEHHGIVAEVYATDDRGRWYVIDGENAATHTVTVRVTDTDT